MKSPDRRSCAVGYCAIMGAKLYTFARRRNINPYNNHFKSSTESMKHRIAPFSIQVESQESKLQGFVNQDADSSGIGRVGRVKT